MKLPDKERIWLDDERPMPAGYTLHLQTADGAISALQKLPVEAISIDCDLGDNAGRGYDVALALTALWEAGKLRDIQATCHSQNPVEKAAVESCWQRARERLGMG